MHLSLRSPQEGGSSAPHWGGVSLLHWRQLSPPLSQTLVPAAGSLWVLAARDSWSSASVSSPSLSECELLPGGPHCPSQGQAEPMRPACQLHLQVAEGKWGFIMFQHKFDGTSDPRGQVWVWPTLPSLRSCSWPIPRWAPEDPQEGKRLELPKPVSVFTGRALTSLHRHPAVLPGLLAPCLQPLPAGESSGCPCPCVTQALTPHLRCPLGPWEPSGDSWEGAGSWADTMLTSLTAPGVIALLSSAQAFWGDLLYAPPNPWDSFQFLGSPWPALQGKARVWHAWRTPGLSQCGKVLCLFWNNWAAITVDSKGSP